MRSERWITIGEVRWPWYVFEMGAGTPGGYLIAWRGRVSVFQPREFRVAEHLCWAVANRLRIAGLEWVAMASEPRRGLYGGTVLKVLVRRSLTTDGHE